MNSEVWEISLPQMQHVLTVLSFLRETTCPLIGRPTVHAFAGNTEHRTNNESVVPNRLILSYPLKAKCRHTTLSQFLKLLVAHGSEVKRALAYQLVQAITFLHDSGVAHQYLSSDSVSVIFGDGIEPKIQITNFGTCTTSGKCSGSYICIRDYRPPEVLLQLIGIDPKAVDSWSLGCLLFEIFTESAAFSVDASTEHFRPQLIKQQLKEMVKAIGRLTEADVPPDCPPRVSQFLLGLDEEETLYSRMRLNCPENEEEAEEWISLVKPLLHFNYTKRTSAKDLLQHKLFAQLPTPTVWSTAYTVASELGKFLE